jgi:hypothetical protein
MFRIFGTVQILSTGTQAEITFAILRKGKGAPVYPMKRLWHVLNVFNGMGECNFFLPFLLKNMYLEL